MIFVTLLGLSLLDIYMLHIDIFNIFGYGFMWAISHLIYMPYIIIATFIVLIEYKKLLWFNLIAVCLIIFINTLNSTGFCYEQKRYLTKREIIDAAFAKMNGYCKDEYPENTKAFSYRICTKIDYNGIKQKYPQCFGENISDICKVGHTVVYNIIGSHISIFSFINNLNTIMVYSDLQYDDISVAKSSSAKVYTVNNIATAIIINSVFENITP